MNIFALRLQPNQDLRQRLKEVAVEKNLQAGFVMSAIGSLKQASIRFADQSAPTVLVEKFEMVALNGTFSTHGLHLHIAIADAKGQTIGGHLCNGNLIYTTAEIVIGEVLNTTFLRTFDPQTSFLELEIQSDFHGIV